MESMDIQVIDEADLPKYPSAPKKKLIAAMGFVFGMILSLGYSAIMYKRHV